MFRFTPACRIVLFVGASPERTGPLRRTLGGIALLWLIRAKADQDIDAEHPEWYFSTGRVDELRDLAIRIAAETPDDAEAVAAIRAADGKPKQWKRAAAWIRGDGYAREHRNCLRAARLLKAAAEGGTPEPPSRDEEALFQAVDDLEALPPDEAFAALASEVPALRALEDWIVTLRSEPGWEERDADDRVHGIVEKLAQLVGPGAPGGSPLRRSHTAFGYARVHLVGKAGLLLDDGEDGPVDPVPGSADGRAEETDLLAHLARCYKVRADLFALAKTISKRVVDHPTYQERTAVNYVLVYLQEPGIVTKLRRGDGPSGRYRKTMTTMVEACKPRLPAGEFIERVLEEVRSALLRDSRDTGRE
jgi:hypothetical protein